MHRWSIRQASVGGRAGAGAAADAEHPGPGLQRRLSGIYKGQGQHFAKQPGHLIVAEGCVCAGPAVGGDLALGVGLTHRYGQVIGALEQQVRPHWRREVPRLQWKRGT